MPFGSSNQYGILIEKNCSVHKVHIFCASDTPPLPRAWLEMNRIHFISSGYWSSPQYPVVFCAGSSGTWTSCWSVLVDEYSLCV